MKTSEFNSLKKRIIAECKKRNAKGKNFGSIESKSPTLADIHANDYIKAEQGKAIIDTLLEIADYPGLKKVELYDPVPTNFKYENLSNILSKLESEKYVGTDKETSSCRGNCTGLCVGSCIGLCNNTCTDACTGLCNSACAGGCNSTCTGSALKLTGS